MKVILFGATGMIGQGVLRECLLNPDVDSVLAIGRAGTGVTHPKLRDHVRDDLVDLADIGGELAGYDACLFCLGVSSQGMSEEAYRRITFDLTLAVARTLADVHKGMRFLYVSGAGTDGSGNARMMWARVKGQTENALLDMADLDAYMFRPAFIQPMYGVKSKTRPYRMMYAAARPFYPVLKRVGRKFVTSTEVLGAAMVTVASRGGHKRILETSDINAI
jgi:uncharacterized protein YbjT (DUF2867 family)